MPKSAVLHCPSAFTFLLSTKLCFKNFHLSAIVLLSYQGFHLHYLFQYHHLLGSAPLSLCGTHRASLLPPLLLLNPSFG